MSLDDLEGFAEVEPSTFDEKDYAVGDTGFFWIDSDTIRDNEGNAKRLANIQAPEVSHVGGDENKMGAASSQAHFAATRNLSRQHGFTDIRGTGKYDDYGRELVDIVNPETGEAWSEFSIKNGLNQLSRYSDSRAQAKSIMGTEERLAGEQQEEGFDEYNELVSAINLDAGGGNSALKSLALSERQYMENPDMYSGVAIRDYNRTLEGVANNQWSTSFDTALIGLSASWGGIQQLVGDFTDNEDLIFSGQMDQMLAEKRIRLSPTTTVDINDIKGVGDFVDYAGNMAAMSLPYMAGIMASTAAGSAIGTLAAPVVGTVGGAVMGATLGLSAPSMVYAGQVYAAQEVKNPWAASTSGILQATVDRLGLKGMGKFTGGIAGNLKKVQTELIKKGMTETAAKNAVIGATRRELAGYMTDAAKFAAEQVSMRNVTREMLNRSVKAFGTEATTEAIQETLGYMGENWDKENFNMIQEGEFQKEFKNRIVNAAAGGGIVGGGMGAMGGLGDAAGWHDVSWKLSNADKNKSKSDFYAAEAQKTDEGRLDNTEYLNYVSEQMHGDPEAVPKKEDVLFGQEARKERRKARPVTEKVGEVATTGVWNLFRGQGWGSGKITKAMMDKSETVRRISSLFLDNLQVIHAGHTYESDLHFNNTEYRSIIGHPKRWYQGYKGISRDSSAKEQFNKDINEKFAPVRIAHNEANIKNKTDVPFDYNAHGWTQQEINLFRNIEPVLKKLEDRMLADQNKEAAGGDPQGKKTIKHQDLYLLKYKAMDKPHLSRNKEKFIEAFSNSYGTSRGDAMKLANDIIDSEGNPESSDEVFNLMSNGVPTQATKKRTVGMSQNPDLAEFFHQDIERNLDEAIRSAARYTTYNRFVGKDSSKVAFMIKKAIDEEGLTEAEGEDVMAAVNDLINSQSGNYKRPKEGTTQAELLKVQKSVSFITLVAALPTAAISSVPELMITMKGLTLKQILGKNGVQSMAKELGSMFYKGIKNVAFDEWTGHEDLKASAGKQAIDRLGFLNQETGAATTTGAMEVSEWRRVWVDRFFHYNGLQGWTNMTRAVRAAPGNDFIQQHLEVLVGTKGQTETNEMRESRSQLRNLGMDVDHTIEILSKAEMTEADMEYMGKQQDLALYNWINDAIVLPGAANRPLFYQDPRFQMITQFNGFISTFTAHHIPKMWDEYIKRGSPAMKYNAFATMMTMVLMGYASQYLKDLLKYGEETPYLEDRDKWRRAINSSGQLGSAERLLNIAVPLYPDKKNKNIFEAGVDLIGSEIPSMGPLSRLTKAGGLAMEGEYNEAAYQALRAAPVFGPFTNLNKMLSGTGD